jgi:hypothetical protein
VNTPTDAARARRRLTGSGIAFDKSLHASIAKLVYPESCSKNGDVPKSPLLPIGSRVPIGGHDFRYRHRQVSASAKVGPGCCRGCHRPSNFA